MTADTQIISKIATHFYDGYEPMFVKHNWPERGQDMMQKVQTRVVENYGSVMHFENVHFDSDPFADNPSVLLTSCWGYHPPSWGCIGFTQEERRNTILKKTTNPFIVAIYVTDGPHKHTPKYKWGKVVGFYEVIHKAVDKKEFIADFQYERGDTKKWRYSLKATRAWQILPEYMPEIRVFDPSIHRGNQMRSVAKHGKPLSSEHIENLKSLPRHEVGVFGCAKSVEPEIYVPSVTRKQYVQGGAIRRSGYEVGEPKDTEKELYILRLYGDEEAYLGFNPEGRSIIKIGLSISPQIRCDFFQKTMPHGAYKWDILNSTLSDGHPRYADFKTAEAGELAMKKYLASSDSCKWLGGEFYLASSDSCKWLGREFYLANSEVIHQAWKIGRETALQHQKEHKT